MTTRAIAHDVLYVKKRIYILPTIRSKTQIVKTNHSFNDLKQLKWDYIEAKKQEKIHNVMVIFIVLNVLICLEPKTGMNLIRKVFENKDFCGVIVSPEVTKILEFNI